MHKLVKVTGNQHLESYYTFINNGTLFGHLAVSSFMNTSSSDQLQKISAAAH